MIHQSPTSPKFSLPFSPFPHTLSHTEKMEENHTVPRKNQQPETINSTSPPQSSPDLTPARLPETTPARSSISSDHSSISHGFSPNRETVPAAPPANVPFPASPPVTEMVVNRSVREDTRKYPEAPPAMLPENTPARSSISSDQSSISHGFSPNRETVPATPPASLPVPEMVVNRSVREETRPVTRKSPVGGGGGGGGARRSLSLLRGPKREKLVKEVGLGIRVCGMLFCLVSLSVMAADKNQGWALDSYDRYKEFRYSMSVNVIGFVYSGAQASYMCYHLATGNYISQLQYFLNFSMDQILTYLLISASSSAATRVEDWQSNWGKDKFPEMARASVIMSFLASVAFALSSLISGYTLCKSKSL